VEAKSRLTTCCFLPILAPGLMPKSDGARGGFVRRSWSVFPIRVLTCSASALVAGVPVAAAAGSDSEAWRGYARDSIQPAFDWARTVDTSPPRQGDSEIEAARKRLTLSIQSASTGGVLAGEGAGPLRRFGLPALSCALASPSQVSASPRRALVRCVRTGRCSVFQP
jgi:hypothetical protein